MWTFKRHVVSQKDMHFFNWFYWSGWFDGLMKGRHLYKPLLIDLLFYRGRKKCHYTLGRLQTKIILSFKPLVWLNHVQSEEGHELTRKKKVSLNFSLCFYSFDFSLFQTHSSDIREESANVLQCSLKLQYSQW